MTTEAPTSFAHAERLRNPNAVRSPQRVLARILQMFPDEFWESHPELASLHTESTAVLTAGSPDPDVVEDLIKRIGALR